MNRYKLLITLVLFTLTGFFTSLSAQSLNLIQEKSFDVQQGQLLELQTDVGDIKLRTWDKNEVHIKVYGDHDAEDDVEFYFKKTDRGVVAEAEKEGGWSWFSNVRMRWEIDVPENFDIDLKTSGGDVVVVDLNGNAVAKTSGGNVEFENVSGEIKAKTSGGNVRLIDITGNIDASTSGGDIKIESSIGKISAKTSGGNVSLDYTGENMGIELGTSGGNVTVTIPDNFKAELYLKTSGGDIECNIEARIKEFRDNKFVGSMNGGGPELTAKTSGGDIRVYTR